MLKSYFVLLAGAAALLVPCSAADFLPARPRAVIGQTYFNAQNTGASNTILGAAGGVAFANNTLFVADDNHVGLLPTTTGC